MFKILIAIFISLEVPFIASSQEDSLQFFTSFDQTKIHYEVKGKGEPVVLIHGFIVDGESWKRTSVYKDLLEAGFKVITLDLRGNGRSGKPHSSSSYSHDAEAKDIMILAKILGLKKYSIVGYSGGSIIASRLLILDKRINKAVIGGIGTGFTDPEWSRRKMFYRALMGDSVPELKAMVKNVQTAGLDQLALAYLQKEQPSTSKEALSKIKQKVLILCGNEDSDNGSAKELAGLIPKAIFKTVPGDHEGAVKTEEFAQEVKLFLTQ